MPTLHYHPAQAGDGRWLQFGNLLPHLFDNFLMVTDLIDIIADPDFEPTQLALPPEKYEPFRDRMLLRLQERPAADWMRDCVAMAASSPRPIRPPKTPFEIQTSSPTAMLSIETMAASSLARWPE